MPENTQVSVERLLRAMGFPNDFELTRQMFPRVLHVSTACPYLGKCKLGMTYNPPHYTCLGLNKHGIREEAWGRCGCYQRFNFPVIDGNGLTIQQIAHKAKNSEYTRLTSELRKALQEK